MLIGVSHPKLFRLDLPILKQEGNHTMNWMALKRRLRRKLGPNRSLEKDLFSTVKIIIALFILICFYSLFHWIYFDNDIIIQPFQTPSNQDYNGEALSNLLTCELMRIKEIHQTNIEISPNLHTENYSIPNVTLRDYTLDYSLSQSGMLGQGPVSLSIGDILLSLKRLLPQAKPPHILSASLQDYGTKVILVASFESSQGLLTWEVQSKDNCSREEIPELVENLAYQVVYSISGHGSGSAKTWQAFANITQGLEAYQAYRSTSNTAQLERARQMALNAQKYEPGYNGSSKLLIAVGLEYAYIGNINQTMTTFDEVTRLNPQYVNAWNYKGIALCILGKYNESIQAFDKAIELNPQFISAWYNKGYSLAEQGKYDEAIQAYDKAIELNPQYADAWFGKGNVLNAQGKYNESIQAFDKAIELNPQNAGAWSNKGNALFSQGKYNESIQANDKAIEINPRYTLAWYNKGVILCSQCKYNESIQAYDKAIELNPQDADAWSGKGNSLYNQSKYNESIQAYDKAIELNPQYAKTWNNKGLALYNQGKYNESIQAYNKAIGINPRYVSAWYNKGNALALQGKYDEAIQAYEKVIELNPQNVDAWFNKGSAFALHGKYNESIQAYNKAIEINPQYTKAWKNKGNALKALGRTTEANAAFAKAKELGYTG